MNNRYVTIAEQSVTSPSFVKKTLITDTVIINHKDNTLVAIIAVDMPTTTTATTTSPLTDRVMKIKTRDSQLQMNTVTQRPEDQQENRHLNNDTINSNNNSNT